MVGIFKGVRSCLAFLSVLTAFIIAWSFKMSPILGSYCSFFSLVDVLTPLAGLGGCIVAFALAFVRTGITVCVLQAPFKALAYHLPGLFASLGWTYPNMFLRVALPLSCIVAFSVHPIGRYAIPYTFYWLIPVGIYFSGKKSIFLHALATTFIAHAVGSVVWLYVKTLPVTVWWSLIPVVAAERLYYAAVMTAFYYVVRTVCRYKNRLVVGRSTSQLS